MRGGVVFLNFPFHFFELLIGKRCGVC